MRDRAALDGLAWAVTAGLVLVGLRSAILVFCEGANFDSDQAVFGLMAKHLADPTGDGADFRLPGRCHRPSSPR
jgi:hypothetical protein